MNNFRFSFHKNEIQRLYTGTGIPWCSLPTILSMDQSSWNESQDPFLYWLPDEIWHEILDHIDKSHHHLIVSVNHLFYDHVMARRRVPCCSMELIQAALLGHQWDIVGITNPREFTRWVDAVTAAVKGHHMAVMVMLWNRFIYRWTQLKPNDPAIYLMTYLIENDDFRLKTKTMVHHILNAVIQYHNTDAMVWLAQTMNYDFKPYIQEHIEDIYRYQYTPWMPESLDKNMPRRAYHGALRGGHVALAQSIYHQYQTEISMQYMVEELGEEYQEDDWRDDEYYGISKDILKACESGSLILVQWLENMTNLSTDQYDRCLETAIRFGHVTLSQYLFPKCSQQWSIQVVNSQCVKSGHREMVEWAVSLGITITSTHLRYAHVVSREYFEQMSVQYPDAKREFDRQWTEEQGDVYLIRTYIDFGKIAWMDKDLLTALSGHFRHHGAIIKRMCQSAGREDLVKMVED